MVYIWLTLYFCYQEGSEILIFNGGNWVEERMGIFLFDSFLESC